MQYLDQVRLDYHKQLVYNLSMIRTFADTETERFYITGKSRRFPPDVLKRAIKRLTQIDPLPERHGEKGPEGIFVGLAEILEALISYSRLR